MPAISQPTNKNVLHSIKLSQCKSLLVFKDDEGVVLNGIT